MDENKDITIKDFVLEYNNFMSKEWCEKIIQFFNYVKDCGLTYNRQDLPSRPPKHIMDDTAVEVESLAFTSEFAILNQSKQCSEFISEFYNKVLPEYTSKYSVLNIINKNHGSLPTGITSLKIQKTVPGQGYHVWHFENGAPIVSNRLINFILYLNDVEDAGETEFLYYPRRIKPEQGKLALWPAGYTHTHRGNPPISGEKYILTGWLEFSK
jgi:hypothetical protein